MNIKLLMQDDEKELIELIADFRVTLASYRGIKRKRSIKQARKELLDYLGSNFPVFIAKNSNNIIIGYIVCRVIDEVVWAESLYVKPEYRRQGIGSALYAQAERLAEQLGNETVYNWIHPTNDKIISFLRKRGYSVLNLIEIRRPRLNEKVHSKISVGEYEFDY